MLTKPSILMLILGLNPTLDPSSDEAKLSEFLGKPMLGDMARATGLAGNSQN